MKRGTAVLTVLLLSGMSIAFAADIRVQPGLWRVTTTISMPGVQMPSVPPATLARLKAMGVTLPSPDQPSVSQVCISREQAAADIPASVAQTGCETRNIRTTANSVSADIVCKSPRLTGNGHADTRYTGRNHYEGSYNFDGMSGGRAHSIRTTFSGDFVSADCGKVKPLPSPAALRKP